MPVPITPDELDKRFTYHPPSGDQPERYTKIGAKVRELADLIVELCPDSREQALAMTHLEEVRMWANAGIARRLGSG